MLEVLINILIGVPSVFIITVVYLIFTSKGECYHCGHRFEGYDTIHKVRNKKTCSSCLINGEWKEDK